MVSYSCPGCIDDLPIDLSAILPDGVNTVSGDLLSTAFAIGGLLIKHDSAGTTIRNSRMPETTRATSVNDRNTTCAALGVARGGLAARVDFGPPRVSKSHAQKRHAFSSEHRFGGGKIQLTVTFW